jgi:hypothetical protein
MHPEAFSRVANDWIQRTAPRLKRKPITIAFEYRAIWDDGPNVEEADCRRRPSTMVKVN